MKHKNNLDAQYLSLLEDIITNGTRKDDRTGTGTVSVFGRQIKHKMSEGFPILTTKKIAWKQVVVELLWFLRGDTNIQFLVKNDCNIWNGDAYKKYNLWNQDKLTMDEFIKKIKLDDEFAYEWGDLGPIYGDQWRAWDGYDDYFDQIKNVIEEIKENPDSRRLIVSAWDVSKINKMTLPPCHYSFQLYTRPLTIRERLIKWEQLHERDVMEFPTGHANEDSCHKILDEKGIKRRGISLIWNQRSVDTFLGLPFNISSYGLLLSIIAKHVDMYPDELIGNLGDTHLYLNHIEQAKEQIKRTSYDLPKLKMTLNPKLFDFDELHWADFYFDNYISHPSIKAPLSN